MQAGDLGAATRLCPTGNHYMLEIWLTIQVTRINYVFLPDTGPILGYRYISRLHPTAHLSLLFV